jgi:hypothetical protein
MRLGFDFSSVFQRIAVKFVPAFLPGLNNSFHLKAAHSTVLDIQAVASKADEFNITTSPKVIEQGLNDGLKLMYYLAANGYRIRTPLFSLKISIPGIYDGTERHLPPGVYPVPRIRINPELRKYCKENVKVEFDGKSDTEGYIGHALDEATGKIDEVMTRGNLLTINGCGIKLESDEPHREQMGVFFKPKSGVPIKASIVAWNSSRLLKVIVPPELTEGAEYQIAVETWSSPKGHSGVFKKARDMRSKFTLITA